MSVGMKIYSKYDSFNYEERKIVKDFIRSRVISSSRKIVEAFYGVKYGSDRTIENVWNISHELEELQKFMFLFGRCRVDLEDRLSIEMDSDYWFFIRDLENNELFKTKNIGLYNEELIASFIEYMSNIQNSKPNFNDACKIIEYLQNMQRYLDVGQYDFHSSLPHVNKLEVRESIIERAGDKVLLVKMEINSVSIFRESKYGI